MKSKKDILSLQLTHEDEIEMMKKDSELKIQNLIQQKDHVIREVN